MINEQNLTNRWQVSILKHDVLHSVNKPTFRSRTSFWLRPFQPPPNPRRSPIAIVLQSPAPSTKEVCVRCSPTPTSLLPAQSALPSLWLMCSICWMMDWAGRGKSSHTFPCVHMAGRLAPLVVARGGVGVGGGWYLTCATALCCVLISPEAHTNTNSAAHPLERQFVPSVHAGHSLFAKPPFPLQPRGREGRSVTSYYLVVQKVAPLLGTWWYS